MRRTYIIDAHGFRQPPLGQRNSPSTSRRCTLLREAFAQGQPSGAWVHTDPDLGPLRNRDRTRYTQLRSVRRLIPQGCRMSHPTSSASRDCDVEDLSGIQHRIMKAQWYRVRSRDPAHRRTRAPALNASSLLQRGWCPRRWIAADGSVWIRRSEIGGEAVRWILLSANGEPQGVIELPRAARVLWSRSDTLWAAIPDELDVPWLVRYRINR
jgi:hypothetical protein